LKQNIKVILIQIKIYNLNRHNYYTFKFVNHANDKALAYELEIKN